MKRKRDINSKAVTVIIIVALIVASLFVTHFLTNDEEAFIGTGLRNTSQSETDKMYVSFIDVGQGNCTLVTLNDTAILIDCGEVGAAQGVENYIKNLSVGELDCVIVTHPHSDHMGGMTKLLYEFEIGDLIMSEIPESIIPTTKTYEKFLTAVSDNAERVLAAEPGETYSYGEITVEIFAPLRDYDDLNDMSVVSRISYGETSVMITGDATAEVEDDLLSRNVDYSADILNVGHHGSKTSTSEAWLEAVNPTFAVICCGSNNDYGHPHSSTLDRLEESNIKYYRTDLNSTVVFESNSKIFTKCD